MNHHITIGCSGSWQKAATPAEPHVSAALRAALTAELIGPRGPLPRFVFRINIKIKDAKPLRALIRASLTNRLSGSPLHSNSALRVGVCVTWTPLNSAVCAGHGTELMR